LATTARPFSSEPTSDGARTHHPIDLDQPERGNWREIIPEAAM